MSNPSKDRGTRWESAIVDTLHASGQRYSYVERRTLAGSADKGDIAGVFAGDAPVVIEAKSVAKLNLAGWVAEAEAEALNAGAPIGVVWAKRVGKASPLDGYVVMSGDTFLELLALTE
jgi:hypothetical protein